MENVNESSKNSADLNKVGKGINVGNKPLPRAQDKVDFEQTEQNQTRQGQQRESKSSSEKEFDDNKIVPPGHDEKGL